MEQQQAQQKSTSKITRRRRSTRNIVAISAGNYHSIALDKDGNVYTWGYNGYGQLGLGNTTNTVLPVKVDDLEGIIK